MNILYFIEGLVLLVGVFVTRNMDCSYTFGLIADTLVPLGPFCLPLFKPMWIMSFW